MSRAIHSPDHSKLPIIVRIGLCGHHRRRRHGPAQSKRASSRKQERRVARRGAL
ncbi:MAG TPA: hypothetical protein VFG64_03805 [Dongiaceae bacterium]|nr:hypothetical protein [Dongiaceae bacterium]